MPAQGGSCARAPQHGEAQVGTGSCFVATSWLCECGILVAPGTFAVSLCWHCTPGWEQSPPGLRRLLAMGWVVLGPSRCCPSTTRSRCGAGTLRAAVSPPHLVPLALARGRGLLSLLSPRGGTHTPGGSEQVCPALPALGVL